MIDAQQAAQYNARVQGKLWMQAELPPPLSLSGILDPAGEDFAYIVASFQSLLGVTVDGKLGTDTLAVMRAWMQQPVSDPPSEHAEEGDDEESLVIPATPEGPRTGRSGVSNAVRIGGQSVALPQEFLDQGISASNFADDDEHQFTYTYDRVQPLRWFVYHESVSMSGKGTIRTLQNKQARSARNGKNGGKGYPYGIHLIGHADGHLSCHADLLDDVLVHANYFNRHCAGIEFVNPYNPKWARAPFTRTIARQWWTWVPKDAEPLYTVPTDAQMRAAVLLAKWLPTVLPDLELNFPSRHLNRNKRRLQGWKDRRLPSEGGIVAHQDFSSHADGRYLLEHAMDELDDV